MSAATFSTSKPEQRPGLGHVVGVSGTEQTPNRLLKPIGEGMKLGGQPTAFLGTLAACRWTLITVLSMRTSS